MAAPLALAPLLWAAWEWRNSARRAGLLLKAASLAAILLALAEPRLTFYESQVALAILVDTSASVSPAGPGGRLRRGHYGGERPRAQLDAGAAIRARSARSRARGTHPEAWKLAYTPGQASHGTNLEAAIREGLATLPAGLVPRVLLISDGNENLGSVTRAIWQAQQRGVPIDVMPLAGRPRPSLVLQSVSMPAQVFSGERFPGGDHPRFSARRASHGGDDRRRQAAGRQPRDAGRRDEPIPRARQHQCHRRHRVGRPRRRRSIGRSPNTPHPTLCNVLSVVVARGRLNISRRL